MILLIDNYDSFTYNLYQYIGEINPDVQVLRNDALTLDEMKGMDLDCIILSPGPGVPEDAGICVDVVREFAGKVPLLGICLGHQADERDYGVGAQILRSIGVTKMRLITNNPVKRIGLEAYGLQIVENVPMEITPNEYNAFYMKTKKERMGHVLHNIK